MKMKLTNQECINLYNVLGAGEWKGNVKFLSKMAQNRRQLKPIVESIQEAAESFFKKERAAAYQQATQDLVKTHAVGADGKPYTRNLGGQMQRLVPAEKMAGFLEAKEALDREYNDVIVAMSAHESAMQSLLREEVEVNLREVPLSDFPEGITQQDMNILFLLVEEDDPTK